MLGWAGGPNVITQVLIRDRQEEIVGDVILEVRGWRGAGRDHKPREAGASRSWTRQPPEGT